MLDKVIADLCSGAGAVQGNLDPEATWLLSVVTDFARSSGLTFSFESGLRSPTRTRELQEQWDAGNRAGLTVRPASDSLHHKGRAFDLVADKRTLDILGDFVVKLATEMNRRFRWGGRFLPPDPGHFDVGVESWT